MKCSLLSISGQELLKPSLLYVSKVLPLINKGVIKSAAYISSTGLLKNVSKLVPDHLEAKLNANNWSITPVHGWIKANIEGFTADIVANNFNCGLGFVFVVSSADANWKNIKGAVQIGEIVARGENNEPVDIENLSNVLDKLSAAFQVKKTITLSNEVNLNHHKNSCALNKINRIAEQSFYKHVYSHEKRRFVRLHADGEKKIDDPILVIGTDGVGTKLKIAQEIRKHDTVGIDLVAMCVNDILCNGAKPLTFLDYYACESVHTDTIESVISGVANGCTQSHSSLVGGKTVEVKPLYDTEEYDLAGFSLGIFQNGTVMPRINEITVGDVVIGLPSSGVHSNGFSLVHKVMEIAGVTLQDRAPYSAKGRTFGK